MLQEHLLKTKAFRDKSGSLPSGIAPAVHSDQFRIHKNSTTLNAKRWDQRLSLEGKVRNKSTLKASASPPDMISLGIARPALQYSPWESMAIEAADPRCISGNQLPKPTVQMSCVRGEDAYDLALAMNYGYSSGSPQLLRFFTEHVQMVHNPPYEDWETCLTSGTTSALEMLFRMFCDRDDWIIVEAHTYSGAIEATKPLGLKLLSVSMDDDGLIAEDLDRKLSNWNTAAGPKPFVLYTVPCGQNPTGVTQTADRRRFIYDIAEKHDLCIIEDDPYYFLQLNSGLEDKQTTAEDFLNGLSPSYSSLDTSGRVMRLDATSKILAPGLRLGWLTGPSQLVARFLSHTDFSNVSPSGPSQLLTYKLLDEAWGHEGFFEWLIYLSREYRRRSKLLLQACDAHLPSDICHWQVPTAGMFIWLTIDWTLHPAYGLSDCRITRGPTYSLIEDNIYSRAKANGVQVSKGSWFSCCEESGTLEMYFRLTFAAAPEEDLTRGVERLGKALRDEFAIGNT